MSDSNSTWNSPVRDNSRSPTIKQVLQESYRKSPTMEIRKALIPDEVKEIENEFA